MNVLWIEDFGHLQPDSATLINFFGGLIPPECFDNHWDQETRLRDIPVKLKEFFSQYSGTHTLTLLKHYGDFVELTRSKDIVGNYDVAAIDINLSSGVPKDIPIPEGHTDTVAFHKKAGFYIYHQLIRIGLPDDNICFLTGEKESTFEELADHCRQALMPLPTAFGKDDVGMRDFRQWLNERSKSDYTTLRRGVIEGCVMLREIVQRLDSIQFNKFVESDADAMGVASMDDYLSTLMRFLPPRIPEVDGELGRVLRLFIRTVSHEWDQKVKPSLGGNSELRSLGWVMRETRNYLAHSQALNQLAVKDVAYIFLVSMRAMFVPLSEPLNRFEAILLSMFEGERRLPDKNQMEKALRDSHAHLLEVFVLGGGEKAERNFRELANRADELRISNIDYAIVLYQILWHQLAQKGKAYDAGGYKCDARSQAFGNEGSFLNALMKSIYTQLLSECRTGLNSK